MTEAVEEFTKGIERSKFEKILENNQYVIVDIFTTWCGPCKMVRPIFHQLAEELTQIKFISVDLDETRWLGVHQDWGTHAIPTFLFFKNNQLVEKKIGGMYKDGFEKVIKSKLLND